jgi:hypothetical protein
LGAIERVESTGFDSESLCEQCGELTIAQHWQAVGTALGVPPDEMPAVMARSGRRM